MLYQLLKENGKRAYKIKRDFTPLFPSIKEYLKFMDSMESSGDRIIYKDGKAEVKI